MNEEQIELAWAGRRANIAQHTVKVFLEDGGTYFEFTCHGKLSDWCRSDCSDGSCELLPCSHMPVNAAECNVIIFLNEDPLSFYQGGLHEANNGFIEYEWDGDTYTWRYAL